MCSYILCYNTLTYIDNDVILSVIGTYNNQYMVVDTKKIELKKAVRDDALWVVEQIPG